MSSHYQVKHIWTNSCDDHTCLIVWPAYFALDSKACIYAKNINLKPHFRTIFAKLIACANFILFLHEYTTK